MRLLADKPMRRAIVVGFLLVTLLLGAQAAANASAPQGPATSTGRAIGQAGFAYLAGLRTFAAAVLWNRLDPQFHLYYRGVAFKNQIQMLPTLRIIQALDPQFQQAYYNAAFILAERGDFAEAVRVAEEGVRNNPNAGLMKANLVQVLIMQDKVKNLSRALEVARAGMAPNITFDNLDDEFESYVSFRTPFQIAKDSATVAAINRKLAELRAKKPTYNAPN